MEADQARQEAWCMPGPKALGKFWEIVKGQGSLVCCSPWGRKESGTTQLLNSSSSKSLMCTPRAEQRPLQLEESEHGVAWLVLMWKKQAEGVGAVALQAVVSVRWEWWG